MTAMLLLLLLLEIGLSLVFWLIYLFPFECKVAELMLVRLTLNTFANSEKAVVVAVIAVIVYCYWWSLSSFVSASWLHKCI